MTLTEAIEEVRRPSIRVNILYGRRKCFSCGLVQDANMFNQYRRRDEGVASQFRRRICRACDNIRNAKKYRAKQAAKGLTVKFVPKRSMSDMSKTCPTCKINKPRSEFWERPKTNDGMAPYCKPCSSDRGRRSQLKAKYGLSAEAYDSMVLAQGNKCAVCGDEPVRCSFKKLVIDHDHATGRVRELLCSPCNTAIGQFRDDPARMESAADYVRKWMAR